MNEYVVKVYEMTNGIICLFKVVEFPTEESAKNYAEEMIENGFGVETYLRIII